MTRLLVTRPAGQGAALVAALAARGIDAVHVPTVAVQPGDPSLLRAALAEGRWDWVVVTSVNGVPALRLAGRLAPTTRVAAVGTSTAAALRHAGIRVDHVPDRFLTEAVAEGLGDVRGARILLARADAATPELQAALKAGGAEVRDVVAYRTIEAPPRERGRLRAALDGSLDGVAFTSGSAVRGLRALLAADPRRLAVARRLPAACIGPVTAAEAERLGWRAWVVAARHTATGLADAIARQLPMEVPA